MSPREGYEEGVRMNTVAFAVIIAVMTILTMVLIQKILDSPEH